MWERFFFYMHRVNAVGLALALTAFAAFLIINLSGSDDFSAARYGDASDQFGSDMVRNNSVIGHDVETDGGKIIAYYESDETYEREELAGLVLVNLETSETLTIASADAELLVDFEFLYEQGPANGRANESESRLVVGYIARTASEADFKAGRSNLIIGALPDMTKTVVAQDVVFADLPTVRSDGNLALVMWQDQESAEVLTFRLSDGAVLDRAAIEIPVVDPDRLSQGPGRASDPALLRQSNRGPAEAPSGSLGARF